METPTTISSAPPAIPTLVEVNERGLFVRAYCPICDKSETSKVEYPGQPRDTVASVAKIRVHLQKRHRKNLGAEAESANKR